MIEPRSMWKIYKMYPGNSGVLAYECGHNYIRIKFRNDSVYRYTYENPGVDEVEQMKMLAEQGKGLSTYINKFIRKRFEEREQ